MLRNIVKTKNKIQPVGLSASNDLTSTVGNTPLIELKRVTSHLNPGVKVHAKAEWFNPSGSVKDRPALNIIQFALESGALKEGMTLLDSTSGNMGIAYATIGAALNIPVLLTVPANASPERLNIISALGAEVILTDPLEGSDGAIIAARELAKAAPHKYYYANQYDNDLNWQVHYRTTGPEIVEQTRGTITHFVAGLGTSGTLTGVASYLRSYNPSIQIVAGIPDGPLHGLEGLKHMPSTIKPAIYNEKLPDKVFPVSTEDAYEMTRRLAKEEGLFVGVSSGAAAVLALRIAEDLKSGLVVTVFPDAGFKYLSDDQLWN